MRERNFKKIFFKYVLYAKQPQARGRAREAENMFLKNIFSYYLFLQKKN